MNDSNLQLTVRGLDARTKEALMKKASQQGVSLNRYALKALQQSAGVEDSKTRYLKMKQFLSANKIDHQDIVAIDEALAWSDNASLEKQSRE